MNLLSVQRIVGLLLMLFSVTMLPPLIVSMIYEDGAWFAFVSGFVATLAIGTMVWLPVRKQHGDLRLRDGFLITVLFWAVLGAAGAVPLLISHAPEVSVTDAVFEAISGLTTTGSTVLVGIDYLPESIRWYRQQLQWFGGMGIIILAVAVAPILGIGGMQLYRAETPGPVKDNKLTPRITETAKALWYIYAAITVACVIAYWLAGMAPFDAIGHAFSTVAIGGFSTHDASIGYYDSAAIELVGVFFILIAAANFGLHFTAWRTRSLGHYFADSEFRTMLMIAAVVTLLVVVYLVRADIYEPGRAFVKALFQAVSIGTTAGFTSADFAAWPGFVPVLLILVSFIGGCAFSTGGGIKVIRILLLVKQGAREVARLVHPSATMPVRIGGRPVSPRVVEAVWGFFSVYVGVFAVIMLLLMASGLDQVTAFSATAATLNNMGPGLGQVSEHFGGINDFAKWVLLVAMLLGRLEIFTLLVVLTPAFWKR
ncbi:MAG: TrkH family potassium uptake protein [Gammaproteobacteria bacterium]